MPRDKIDPTLTCNCWGIHYDTFSHQTKFCQGFEFHHEPAHAREFVRMKASDRHIEMRLANAHLGEVTLVADNSGEISVQRIVRTHYDRNAHRFEAPQPDLNDTYLWICSHPEISLHSLWRRKSPQPIIEKSTLWVGCEGFGEVEHCGKRSDPRKEQLFRIRQGREIYFFDGKRQAWIVTAREFGSPPKFRLATRKEIAEWAFRQGEIRGRENRDTREWARGVLEETAVLDMIARYTDLYPVDSI